MKLGIIEFLRVIYELPLMLWAIVCGLAVALSPLLIIGGIWEFTEARREKARWKRK